MCLFLDFVALQNAHAEKHEPKMKICIKWWCRFSVFARKKFRQFFCIHLTYLFCWILFCTNRPQSLKMHLAQCLQTISLAVNNHFVRFSLNSVDIIQYKFYLSCWIVWCLGKKLENFFLMLISFYVNFLCKTYEFDPSKQDLCVNKLLALK